MEIYERITILRKKLKLNQGEFASSLGFAQSTIGMMEVGKREVSDRHIKTICSIYGVNEDWLINGKEPMFLEQSTDYIEKLAEKYNGDDLFKNIISAFLKLNDNEKAAVLKFIDSLEPDSDAKAVLFAASSADDQVGGTTNIPNDAMNRFKKSDGVIDDDDLT